MLQLFINTSDKFLCSNVKKVFKKVETNFMQEQRIVDLNEELRSFENNPLSCTIGNKSEFETAVKVKIKLILALFYVILPLTSFAFLAYIANVPYTYAFVMTFVVAILVASRMEEIAKRYVDTRTLQTNCKI